jgi:hypothetical protein
MAETGAIPTRLRAILFLGILALAAPAAQAQFNQYVAPGEFEIERESRMDQLDDAIQESRWRLGRLYLNPWVAVRDITYLDNVGRADENGDKQSDVTAKLGLGLQGYAPVGSEVTFAFHALPEYVWWNDLSGRRRWNGHYGAGFFGDLGRTGFEATVTRADDSVFFSREIEEPVNTREDRLDLKLEIELFGPVDLYLAGYGRQLSYEDDPESDLGNVDLLNRDELVYQAGLEVALGRGFDLGLGAEFSDVEFENTDLVDRSNTGTSPFVALDFDGERVELRSTFVFRDLEAEGDSDFVPYDEVTGRALLSFVPTGRSEIQLFWNRNLVYTRNLAWSYFTDSSIGAALLASLGGSSSVRVFYEVGDNEYTNFVDVPIERTDDYDSWGVTLRFDLGPTVLSLGTTQTDYDSNLEQFDRKISVIRAGFTFGSSRGFPWT